MPKEKGEKSLLGLESERENAGGLGRCGGRARVLEGARAVQVGGGDAGLGRVRAAVAEGGGERGRAGLVVEGGAAVVCRRVDRDGPHAGRVAVAVAVVVLAAVSRRPHIDTAQAVATLLGLGERESSVSQATNELQSRQNTKFLSNITLYYLISTKIA